MHIFSTKAGGTNRGLGKTIDNSKSTKATYSNLIHQSLASKIITALFNTVVVVEEWDPYSKLESGI